MPEQGQAPAGCDAAATGMELVGQAAPGTSEWPAMHFADASMDTGADAVAAYMAPAHDSCPATPVGQSTGARFFVVSPCDMPTARDICSGSAPSISSMHAWPFAPPGLEGPVGQLPVRDPCSPATAVFGIVALEPIGAEDVGLRQCSVSASASVLPGVSFGRGPGVSDMTLQSASMPGSAGVHLLAVG